MKIDKLTNDKTMNILDLGTNAVKRVIKNTTKNNSLERTPMTDEFAALVANDNGLLGITLQKSVKINNPKSQGIISNAIESINK